MKSVAYSLLFLIFLAGCGSTTVSTGPSVHVGNVAQIGLHLNTKGEFVIDGQVSIPLTPPDEPVGASWDIAFETVLNKAQQESNYLIVLWDDGKGNIIENDYSIGQPFDITFEHDQWVREIKRAGNGNIIVSVEKQAMAVETPPTLQPMPTETKVQNSNSFATISCANDITQASLRSSPGYLNKDDTVDVIYKIDCGQTVELLGGSQYSDGLTWWKVSWNGYSGWMADHTTSGRIILVFNP